MFSAFTNMTGALAQVTGMVIKIRNDTNEKVFLFGSKGLESIMEPGKVFEVSQPAGTWCAVYVSSLKACSVNVGFQADPHSLEWWKTNSSLQVGVKEVSEGMLSILKGLGFFK